MCHSDITPDPSGISYYDEALFIETIRTGQVKARKLNSIMPWGYFRNMTDDDLKAIFAYLRSLKPVQHRVDNTKKAAYCSLLQIGSWVRQPQPGQLIRLRFNGAPARLRWEHRRSAGESCECQVVGQSTR